MFSGTISGTRTLPFNNPGGKWIGMWPPAKRAGRGGKEEREGFLPELCARSPDFSYIRCLLANQAFQTSGEKHYRAQLEFESCAEGRGDSCTRLLLALQQWNSFGRQLAMNLCMVGTAAHLGFAPPRHRLHTCTKREAPAGECGGLPLSIQLSCYQSRAYGTKTENFTSTNHRPDLLQSLREMTELRGCILDITQEEGSFSTAVVQAHE